MWKRGKTLWERKPHLKLNSKELIWIHDDGTRPQKWTKVSELLLSEALGENVCNLLIYGEILQNNCFVMHKFSNVVYVYLDVFGSLSMNRIYRDLDRTFIVTKNGSRWSTTNIKLRQNTLQPNFLYACINCSPVLYLCWRKGNGSLPFAWLENRPNKKNEN